MTDSPERNRGGRPTRAAARRRRIHAAREQLEESLPAVLGEILTLLRDSQTRASVKVQLVLAIDRLLSIFPAQAMRPRDDTIDWAVIYQKAIEAQPTARPHDERHTPETEATA